MTPTERLTNNDDVKVHPEPAKKPVHSTSRRLLPDAFADDRAALHEEEEGHARVPLASHGEDRAFVKDARRQEYFSCGCCRVYLGDEHRFEGDGQ